MNRYKLFEENERLAYFTLHRYFPGYTIDEDLIQIAKLGLWKACLNYNPEKGQLATCAVIYIRNEVSTALRSKSPAYTSSLDQAVALEEGEGNTLLDFLADPRAAVAMRDAEFDFAQAMAQCTPQQRRIIALRIAGKSQAEIGQCVGCVQSKVSRELQRARKRILGGAVNA